MLLPASSFLGKTYAAGIYYAPSESPLMATTLTPSQPSTPVKRPPSGLQQLSMEASMWFVAHPIRAIFLASLLAVIVNCYPIVFCGRSFVTPTCVPMMVYNQPPPLPGMEPALQMSEHGNDTGAMMWGGVPAGFVASRSLLQHGELPLWNRYSHAGDTLIGQAVTMVGDPLHLIVLLGRGSAGAWDLKYLLAKFLFCVGFGLLILQLTRNSPLAVIYAWLAAYCGVFFYIFNHPSFFVWSYAPWILLSAIKFTDLNSKQYPRWGLLWLLVNFACFNAGMLSVGVVLIAGLNLAALANACLHYRSPAAIGKVTLRLGVGTFLFLGLTAPFWLSFLGALDGSYSSHMIVKVEQLPLSQWPGAFDDLFHLLVRTTHLATAPGASLLILAGCLISLFLWRHQKEEPFFWVNAGAIFLWGGCVFGWVPAPLLASIPLLNRVGHLHTDFSYLLIMHLTIQSAYGFKSLAEIQKFSQAAGALIGMAAGIAGAILAFWMSHPGTPIPWFYFIYAGAGAIGAPLLFTILRCNARLTHPVGWIALFLLGMLPLYRFGYYHFNNSSRLLMAPGPREALDYPSPSIRAIKTKSTDPFRIAGLKSNLIGDYSAVYELEDIRSCAPLTNEKFIEVIQSFPGMKIYASWVMEIINPIQAQPLLNMLNIKYLLAPLSLSANGQSAYRVAGRNDFLVLENPQVWPRAFFSNKVFPINSSTEFVAHLLKNGKEPSIAVSDQEIAREPLLHQLTAVTEPVIHPGSNYRLLPNSTAFDIYAPTAGAVCLTEGQVPDFTATANGKPRQVLTLNRAFKGIYLDKPGNYHIEFTYRPKHWRLACALFWLSISGTVVVLMVTSTIPARLEKSKSITPSV